MLKSNEFYNETVATQFGEVKFNAEGISNDLKPQDVKYLAERVNGLTFIEEPKAEKPKVEEPKVEKPKVEEPKKAAPKKAAPKKETLKKDNAK